MAPDIYPIIALVLITGTSITLFMIENWRLSIVLLAIQYIGVFFLVQVNWPISMAMVKLVAGWISGAILGMAMISIPDLREKLERYSTKHMLVSRLFYLLTAVLILMVVVSQANNALKWFPEIGLEHIWSGFLLIGMGLFKLGFSEKPFPGTLGLLTALSGFEIIYATIAISALLAGLLAGITLGLGLAGSYLLMAPYLEET